MPQVSWQRIDNNGPGAKTDVKIDRKPQAISIISCSFLINFHLFSLYLHIYVPIYILILSLPLTFHKSWQAWDITKSFCIM